MFLMSNHYQVNAKYEGILWYPSSYSTTYYKKDDDKLLDRFRFLNLVWAFFTDRSFLAEYLYNNVVSFIVFLVI